MRFIKCEDIAEMVISQATERLGRTHMVDEVGRRRLWDLLSLLDEMAEEWEIQSCSVEVESDLGISVSVVVPMITASEVSDPVFDLLRAARSFSMAALDTEFFTARFVYPGIWTYR